MEHLLTGAAIRQSFIDFFVDKKGHTFVPSSSLVPGGDQTLLFTNAGMVQFKDVFLGEDHRPYVRAANSQKCIRVAGKHNDLDEVGRDDTHHTFFEMLGNWSFGDYYKKEAIAWAWELITKVWGLDASRLWATTFKDEYGQIPTDDEAYLEWKNCEGMNPAHIMQCGRKDNFWEMADTGPCGPCSEIHYDLGPEFCDKQGFSGHVCQANGDCKRIVEFWNLVFIQYNRVDENTLVPLPKTHVDTGMGFERIVSILQKVYSNYRTDLFKGVMASIRNLAGHSEKEMEADFTPYRVIADHSRAAAFLIADGVVPGNVGRNYICRMIIRRASRFGGKIGLHQPFLADVTEEVIKEYGNFYPELVKNRKTILDNITREEERFHRTLEAGLSQLETLIRDLEQLGECQLDGISAFELYATHGLPLEITRDILTERGYSVDDSGFRTAMENHRIASGAGKAFGEMGGDAVDLYRGIYDQLVSEGELPAGGVRYDPYSASEQVSRILALVLDNQPIEAAEPGMEVEFIVPTTGFYIESGGQVADQGRLRAQDGRWEINVTDVRRPAAGIIAHCGVVTFGQPHVGDLAFLEVDRNRRFDIMRNHTATHLLHSELQKLLGEHARQAGSMVSPDRLRFDFTHPKGVTADQLREIEARVNFHILQNHPLTIQEKSREEALLQGAMALFGEKYGDTVRTVTIGDQQVVSYELCGGTHVPETGVIGTFLIVSESSVAAGIRRIEAVTGSKAFHLVQQRLQQLRDTAGYLECSLDETPAKTKAVLDQLGITAKEINNLQAKLAGYEFERKFSHIPTVNGIPVMAALIPDASIELLRQMTDRFREQVERGVVVLGAVINEKPTVICAVTDNLVAEGYHAGNFVKSIAAMIGGNGGGKPNIAQAGGKDANKLQEAIDAVPDLIRNSVK
ncbi:MAG: alanine--tRNA ligase [Anaerolineae bacterium]|nr:alanine--tRNA ligase [Anaerolineae bacterium]